MYCSKCGTQNPDDASFCFKCGNDISKFNISKTEKANPSNISTKDETEVKFENRTKTSESLPNTSKKLTADTTKSSASNEWSAMTYIKASIILTVILMAWMFLSTSNQSNANSDGAINSPTQPKGIVFITANPAQMLPTINDMPDGFMKGSGIANGTYAEQDFINTGFAKQMLSYKVSKFYSIEKAIDKYNSIVDTYSNYKLTNAKLGDESVGYELANTVANVVIRKANTVIEVQLAGTYTATLDDAISYAKMVKTPTTNVKLITNTRTLTIGESWDFNDGSVVKVISTDLKSNPKLALLEISFDGKVSDLSVYKEGSGFNDGYVLDVNVDSISDSGVTLTVVIDQNKI